MATVLLSNFCVLAFDDFYVLVLDDCLLLLKIELVARSTSCNDEMTIRTQVLFS